MKKVLLFIMLATMLSGTAMGDWVRPDLNTSLFCQQGGNCSLNILNVTITNVNETNSSGDLWMNNNEIRDILHLHFNITNCNSGDEEPGTLCHNVDDDTLEYYTLSGQTIQFGREVSGLGKNNEGSFLPDGSVVSLFGYSGDNRLFIAADGSNISKSSLVGVLTTDCNASAICPVTVFGDVRDVDTSAWNSGDMLWINPDEPGNLTNVKPSLPNNPIVVGYAGVIHANVGTIFAFPNFNPSDGFLANNGWFSGNLTVADKLYFLSTDEDQDHFITMGSEEWNGGLTEDSFWFDHDEAHSEGEILLMISAQDTMHFYLQKGRNNSASFLGNSFFVGQNSVPANVFNKNMTLSSNCLEWYDYFNKTVRVICDSSDGADFIVQDDNHVWGELWVGDPATLTSFNLHGSFNNVLNGFDANFFNGSVHPQTPVSFTTGFNQSQRVTLFNAVFAGSLSPFVNEQDLIGNWVVTQSVLCDDDDECAEANGADGLGTVITMNASYSSNNFNETNLSFVYSLSGIPGGGDFSVELNNGSGWEEVYSDTGTDVLTSVNLNLDAGYTNVSNVDIRVNCDGSNIVQLCFIDSVQVVGLAMIDTTANQTGFDSEVCFSDGSRDVNGDCNRGIRYDAESDTIYFAGSINASGTVTGGVSGSGTANNIPKFTASTSLGNSDLVDDGTYIYTLNRALGVGTSTPIAKLEVDGQGTTTELFRITNNTAGDIMTVRNTGRVGIGTNAPQSPLHLKSSSDATPGMLVETSKVNGVADIRIKNDAQTYTLEVNSLDWFRIRDQTGGTYPITIEPGVKTNMLYLENTNKIGINGYTSPEEVLHIRDGNIKFDRNSSAGGIIGVVYSSVSASQRPLLQMNRAGGTYSSPLPVQNNWNLGSVDWFGYANSAFRASAQIQVTTDAAPSGNNVPSKITFFASNSSGQLNKFFRFDSTGYIGVNKANPSYPIDVNLNNSGISIYAQGNMSATGYITRTHVYKDKEKALKKIKNSSEYFYPNGTINHDAFEYSKVKYKKIVNDQPYKVTTEMSVYNNITKEYDITNITFTEYTTKETEEKGVSLDKEVAMLKQAIYEMSREMCDYKAYTWC